MANRQVSLSQISRRGGQRSVPSNAVISQEPAAVLAREKTMRVDQLWTACDAYERQFFSGGAHAQILELKLGGSQKAVRTQQWILSLWLDYYARKDKIAECTHGDAVHAVSIDFSTHAQPPYSIREMLADVAL